MGYVPRGLSAHLTFGLLYHAALERYDHAKAQGQSHEDCVRAAVVYCLTETWDESLGRPWISDNNLKTRDSLLRTVIWYLDKFEHDPCETIILSNGKPAVELSFRFETGFNSDTDGRPFIFCGHLDRVATFSGKTWILDKKTTKYTLDQDYAGKYTPDNQMSGYSVAGQLVLGEPVAGIIVDACQIGVTFSRYQRYFIHRHQSMQEEWLNDLSYWFKMAEAFAVANYWPMNDKSCLMYYSSSDPVYSGCPYRGVCGIAPALRQAHLDASFSRAVWDPLLVRGDV
jgi:hypothetical protein